MQMTFPDKTIYPIASCNDVDYKNLTDVYMDAVFHPNIIQESRYLSRKAGIMSLRMLTHLLLTMELSTMR